LFDDGEGNFASGSPVITLLSTRPSAATASGSHVPTHGLTALLGMVTQIRRSDLVAAAFAMKATRSARESRLKNNWRSLLAAPITYHPISHLKKFRPGQFGQKQPCG
jgi:hypothetical protein